MPPSNVSSSSSSLSFINRLKAPFGLLISNSSNSISSEPGPKKSSSLPWSEEDDEPSVCETISSKTISSFSPLKHNLSISFKEKFVDFLSCVNLTIVSK